MMLSKEKEGQVQKIIQENESIAAELEAAESVTAVQTVFRRRA